MTILTYRRRNETREPRRKKRRRRRRVREISFFPYSAGNASRGTYLLFTWRTVRGGSLSLSLSLFLFFSPSIILYRCTRGSISLYQSPGAARRPPPCMYICTYLFVGLISLLRGRTHALIQALEGGKKSSWERGRRFIKIDEGEQERREGRSKWRRWTPCEYPGPGRKGIRWVIKRVACWVFANSERLKVSWVGIRQWWKGVDSFFRKLFIK